MNAKSPTQTVRRNVAIGIEFFSQEQILEGLEEARLAFANDDVDEVSRKNFITYARDLMSEKYGLAKTILRPRAKSGIYAVFNDQMQRFFRRSGELAKSKGSQPSSMIDLSGDAYYAVRDRWQAKLLKEALEADQIGCLLTTRDILEFYQELGFVNDDVLETVISEKEIRKRVKKMAFFMQEYCNDFPANHRKIAVEHTEKFSKEQYLSVFMVLFYNSRDQSFGSLYVDDPKDVYYSDIWWEIDFDFDEIAIRRPHGEAWTDSNRKNFLKMLSKQLGDGVSITQIVDSDVYLVLSVERTDD
jgi:hypothetical protein